MTGGKADGVVRTAGPCSVLAVAVQACIVKINGRSPQTVRGSLRPVAPARGVALAAFVALGLSGACALLNRNVKTQSLGNNEFRLECQGSLSRCLDEADNICLGSRFEVISGKDKRDYFGPAGLTESEVRTSEAVIRCGHRGRAIFGDNGKASAGGSAGATVAASAGGASGSAGASSPAAAIVAPSVAGSAAPSAAPSVAPSAAPSARACIPGATQVCVGPAACRGGQVCLHDGSAFGPCDCGPAVTPAPASAAH